MEEIQKYSYTRKGCNLCLDVDYVKYSDHKAVVESKDKKIQVLETTLNFRDESIVKMQNKIDELEKLNESLKRCTNCNNQSVCPIWSPEINVCSNWEGIK